MEKNKFTIVTVCYNVEEEIEETMESVLKQSYENYEYIIIDGKSKDNTLDKIVKLQKKYFKREIRYISEKDSGIYDAMNKGIDMASSQWIIFMNAGDSFFSNEVLEKVNQKLTEENDVVYGDIIASDKRLGKKIRKPKNLESLKDGMIFCHQAVFLKTSIMKKYKFDTNYKIAADYNLFYHLYKLGYKFNYLSEIIAIYDLDGISSNFLKNNIEKYKINKSKKFFFNILKFMIKSIIKKVFTKKYLLEYQRKKFLTEI